MFKLVIQNLLDKIEAQPKAIGVWLSVRQEF